MTRERISTTVDAEKLGCARRLVGGNDSKLFDLALGLLVASLEKERELEALGRQPYDHDADLAWLSPTGPALAYDADVPEDVLALARRRRGQTG